MARAPRPVFGAAPVESFPIVMATGIVAVAAREDAHPVVALALGVLAGCGLVAVVAWAALARAGSGRGVACGAGGGGPCRARRVGSTGRSGPGPRRIDYACGMFGFVAAVDVVAAQLDAPAAAGVVALLGAVAAAAWVLLVIHVACLVCGSCGPPPRAAAPGRLGSATGRVRARRPGGGWAAIRTGARGGWLLVAVATQSLVLIAARIAPVVGTASGPLLVACLVGWVSGVLAYLAIASLVVARMLAARMAPGVLTPDMWVLMGAVAIAVVAGGAVLDVMPDGALATVARGAVVACWVVATAWIPALVAAERHRARDRRLRYERARWSTVFPLGMYVVACATVADRTSLTGGRGASAALYWVALAAWCLTAVGALSHVVKPHG